MSAALMTVAAVHKRFGRRVVLEEIDLAFPEGSVTGIIGPNGAGKTTCFNVLTGRFRPDRGSITFAGEDITGCSPRAIAGRGIARSFQQMNLFDDFSALDNVRLAVPSIRRRPFDAWGAVAGDASATGKAQAVLARVGLSGKEHVGAKHLAYGDRRALEIAVALAAEPRLLFLDEPCAGLGTAGIARLSALVASLKGAITLVIIEHDLRFLFAFADQVAVIHWGQVIARGTPAELRADPWARAGALGDAVESVPEAAP